MEQARMPIPLPARSNDDRGAEHQLQDPSTVSRQTGVQNAIAAFRQSLSTKQTRNTRLSKPKSDDRVKQQQATSSSSRRPQMSNARSLSESTIGLKQANDAEAEALSSPFLNLPIDG